MTPTATAAPQGVDFGRALIAHLDDQLASARRLLDAVLRQGQAVRARNVEGVLACLTEVQAEMERRGKMERTRTAILEHAARHLDKPAHAITIDHLVEIVGPVVGPEASLRSQELRGLLSEIGREHAINRALMRQEMAFLDHLTRLIGGDAEPGYRPPAPGSGANGGVVSPVASSLRVLDLRA